jgi:serine/threonine protein kinase/tetratricopeptide (TPR) repeat protein
VIAKDRRACPVCNTLFPDSSESCPVCALRRALGNEQPTNESSIEPVPSSPFRFEHYEILKHEDGTPVELGRGAMGVTYKALDINLQCAVALKVISARLIGDESARRRFVREARAAASVRHPNVASVFHLGKSGDSYFYAMEFVEGESLDKIIRRSGRLESSVALGVATRVAAGLEAIQKQNLVHRDIKPSNIMVSFDGDKIVNAKIIDLGLAKGAVAEDDSISSPGTFIGTPQYASPEQFAGIGADIRSDLYALGITLWEMLSGKLPFQGSSAELMQQHRHAVLPMEKLAGSPQPINSLLEVLLEKDPTRRFQSPADIIQVVPTITKAMDSRSRVSVDKLRSLALESIKRVEEPKKGWRRLALLRTGFRFRWLGWVGLALLVAAGLLLVTDFFFPLSFLHRQRVIGNPGEKSIAVLPFESLSGNKDDLYFADGIQNEILSKLSKVSQLRVISRTSVMRYGRGERQDLRSIANTLGVTNVVEGTVTRVGQRVRIKTDLVDATRDQTIWSETYDRDLTDIFSIQSDVAERVASALRGKLSRDEQATIRQIPTQNLAAYDFYLRGWALYQLYRQEDNEKAIDLFKQALALDPKFALSYSGLASAYVERVARFHGEKSWIDSAIHLCRQAIALDPKEIRGYTELVKALLFKDLGEEAREPIRKALELDPNDWRANLFAADQLAGTRRYDERYAYLRKSFAVNPTDTHAPNSLAYLCAAAGDNDWAEKWLQRAIDLETDPQRHVMMECELSVLRGDYAAASAGLQKLPSDFIGADEWPVRGLLLVCHFHLKDWPAMLRLSDELKEDDTWRVPFLGAAIALRNLGRETEAIQSAELSGFLDRMNLVAKIGPVYWTEWALAASLRFLGRNEEAYQYLRASFLHGDVFSANLLPDAPSVGLFKSDPEFQAILAVREKENVQLRAKMRAIEATYK